MSDAITASHWEEKARSELETAILLHRNRQWGAAHHHAGFSIECALKARLMRREGLNSWPDRSDRRGFYTHNLDALLRMADLRDSIADEVQHRTSLGLAWLVAKDWSNETRYDPRPFPQARCDDMIKALSEGGLFAWLLP